MNYPTTGSSPNFDYAAVQEQILAANRQAKGYATDCDHVPPPSMTSDVFGRIGTLGELLSETNSNLTNLSDRLFGATPRPVMDGQKASNKPMGQVAELIDMLDGLIERARYASFEAGALNSRI